MYEILPVLLFPTETIFLQSKTISLKHNKAKKKKSNSEKFLFNTTYNAAKVYKPETLHIWFYSQLNKLTKK